jgi:hypothetical protein
LKYFEVQYVINLQAKKLLPHLHLPNLQVKDVKGISDTFEWNLPSSLSLTMAALPYTHIQPLRAHTLIPGKTFSVLLDWHTM